MVAHKQQTYATREEYLSWERQSATKNEYHDGVIVAPPGASRQHNRITLDTARSLADQLEGRGCEPFASGMRVFVPECNRYFYPDVVVACGEAQYEDAELDTLLDPTLIVEVLSSSTERADRRLKFDCYRTLPSLQTYVLIAQDETRIETFTRQENDTWLYDVASGREAIMPLPAINCTLPLADVYSRIVFIPQDTLTSETDT